jgi:hypothetical protein
MKLLKNILIKKTCKSQKMRMKFEREKLEDKIWNDLKQNNLQVKEWVLNCKD